MKKFTLLTQFALSFLCTTAIAMENNNYQFHQATPQHTQQIVNVINKYGVADNTKIVILPEKFRYLAVEKDIAQKRLYCATTPSQEVVAFKKLFIIDNEDEHNDITINEIRCVGDNNCLKIQIFNPHNNCIPLQQYKSSHDLPFANNLTLYTGSDYTVPAHRKEKINSTLTQYAFDSIKNDTIDTIKKNNFDNIVLLYGLTKANAGENGGIDRTPSIVRAFRNFAEQVSVEAFNKPATKNTMIIHSHYEAFMPTFNPISTECVPLPDDKSIAGYGNVLFFPLNK